MEWIRQHLLGILGRIRRWTGVHGHRPGAYGKHELVQHLKIFVAIQPGVFQTEVEVVFPELFVVGSHIEHDRQHTVWRNSACIVGQIMYGYEQNDVQFNFFFLTI